VGGETPVVSPPKVISGVAGKGTENQSWVHPFDRQLRGDTSLNARV
jgi:hypothetical protein